MLKRLTYRTLILAVLTVAAFVLMQPLTMLSGWPEVLQCLKAAAVLAWAEHSIMILRIVMQPRIDVQSAAQLERSESPVDSRALASLYWAHQFTWAVRLTAFIVLYGVL